MRSVLRSPLAVVTLIVATWFAVTFLVLPNVQLVQTVFVRDGQWSLRAVDRLFASPRVPGALLNSFLLAAVLAVTVNVLGVFIVLVTSYFQVAGSRILWLGYATTLVYGGIVQVAGYRVIYGEQGFVTSLLASVYPGMDRQWFTGMAAVVFVMTIAGTGNHLLFLGRVVNRVDQNTIEAARMMGASSFTVVRRIVLPTVAPMVYAITVLTFLAGLGALAAPQVLGGEKFQTITPLILSLAGSPGSRDIAAVLSIVLGASTIVLLAVLMRIERRGVYFSISKVPASLQRQRLDSRTGTIAMHVTAYLLFVVYTLPPALIVLFSFTNASAINEARIGVGDLTLENYRRVLTDASAAWPFVVSVGYAATAAVVCVGGLLFVARVLQRHRTTLTTVLEYVLHLPWILPSTMIALGLLVTFDRGQPLVADLVLAGTPALLGVAYVVVKVPFTLRLLKAAYAGVQDNVEEAAAILGASGLTAFRRVVLPLVVPIAAAVAGLTFTSLLDEYDAAAFLHHPLYPPLGIVIRNAAVQDTMTDTTALMFVYTVLLMIVSSIALWLVYGSGARRLGLVGRRRRSVDVER